MDNYVPNMTVKKQYKPFEKKDFAFLFIFFVASFAMANLAIFGGFHLGFTIAYFVLFCASTAYLFDKSKGVSLFTVLCGILSLAGSVTFAIFNDYFVNFIMFILVCGLYVAYTLGLSKAFMYNVGSFKMLIDMAKDVLVHPFMSLGDVFGGIKASANKNKKPLSSIAGVAIALPFVIVLGTLLMQSDVAFESLVTKIFKNIGIYIFQVIIAFVVTPYLFSNAYSKRKGLNREVYGKDFKIKSAPVSACVSFLGMISVLYVVYLVSQLAYFFSAFKGILPDDYKYTASAFARRGFFEMFAICVINVIIISVVCAIVKKRSGWIKTLSCFISLFSVLMLVTAMQKMKLNMSIYGLTKNRVLVAVFMLMMFVVIAFFILHIFVPKLSYMQPIIVICSCIFIAMSFADIDYQIAKYNVDAYNSGAIDTLDMDTIGDLSDSAVPYLVELTESEDEEIAKRALRICGELYATNYKDYFRAENKSKHSFKDYSYKNSQAVLALDDAKRSEDIAKTSVFYNTTEEDSEYWYDEDGDYYEHYSYDNTGTQYHYNKKTGLYDIEKSITYDELS